MGEHISVKMVISYHLETVTQNENEREIYFARDPQ